MNQGSSDHDAFAELTAGYALTALDEVDLARLRAHLATCAACRAQVAEFDKVIAALADAVSPIEPPASLRSRLLETARSNPPGHPRAGGPQTGDAPAGDTPREGTAAVAGSAPVVAMGSRSRRRRALLVAAGILVAGGVTAGALLGNSGIGSPPANCTTSTGCTQAALTSVVTHQVVATVIVSGGSVWLRPVGLRPDDPARQVYVLWELVPAKAPRAVGSFDVAKGVHKTISVGSLVASYDKAPRFAVSLQRGRVIPPAPGRPVAVGKVT